MAGFKQQGLGQKQETLKIMQWLFIYSEFNQYTITHENDMFATNWNLTGRYQVKITFLQKI